MRSVFIVGTPKEMGELTPVPSVVCVLVIKTMWISMFNPSGDDIELL